MAFWNKKKAVPVRATVSLSTHTVYPEIFVDESYNFVGRLYQRNGTVMEMVEGQQASRAAAIDAASWALDAFQHKYIKE